MGIQLCYYENKNDSLIFIHALTEAANGQIHIVPPEQHLKYEICYVISGIIDHEIEGEKYIVNRGDMILIDFNELHTLKVNLDDNYERLVVQFSKDILPPGNEGIDLFYPFNQRKYGYKTIIPAHLIEKSGCRSILTELEKYALKNDPFYDPLMKAFTVMLLYTLNDIVKSNTTKPPVAVNQTVKKTIEYIMKNLTEPLNIDTLAKVLLTSKYYLCHTFKKHVGLSIGQYAAKQKMAKAASLISSGVSPLETSKILNFETYSSFYKAFIKNFGVSPKKFKNPGGHF